MNATAAVLALGILALGVLVVILGMTQPVAATNFRGPIGRMMAPAVEQTVRVTLVGMGGLQIAAGAFLAVRGGVQ